MSTIRQAELRDVPGIYRVCLETGDPAAADRGRNPDLLGHLYAGPYVAGEPELARVIADGDGIAGYFFGCADTLAFDQWCERHWWPPLRAQYPLGSGAAEDASYIRQLHEPQHPPADVAAAYPAHLHIDLLDRARGKGYGRELVDWLCGELATRGVPGIHLGVGSDNDNAIAFYRHLGFSAAIDDVDTDDTESLWMTRPLA